MDDVKQKDSNSRWQHSAHVPCGGKGSPQDARIHGHPTAFLHKRAQCRVLQGAFGVSVTVHRSAVLRGNPPPPKKTQRPLGAGGFALNRGRLATPECLGACTVRSIHRAHPSGASIGGTHASVQMRPRGFSCAALGRSRTARAQRPIVHWCSHDHPANPPPPGQHTSAGPKQQI